MGLGLFGATLGVIVALSRVSGISASFVTSLFTFVGGVLLMYAGFRTKPDEERSISLDRVGKALSCFSVGVLLGLFGGVLFREYAPHLLPKVQVAPETPAAGTGKSAAAKQTDVARPNVQLNTGQLESCGRLRDKLYAGELCDPEAVPLIGDLLAFVTTICPRNPPE